VTRRDITRSQVELLLMREAGLAEHYGRLFERAAAGQDLVAAPAVIGH
jgi:hypothetical protein